MSVRYLKVGSWNIEHFGRTTDDNDENPYAIAQHLELADVDIMALQELYADDDFHNPYLEKALSLLYHYTGDRWQYEIFSNRNAGDRSQLCGVAWNTAKVTKQQTLRIPVETRVDYRGDRLWLWDRTPHAVKFSTGAGKTDLVLISVHMKSNVGQRRKVMRTRYEEAKTLMANIDLVAEQLAEKDIVILGDTNCQKRSEDAIQTFLDAGFEDLNEDDITTYVKGNKAPFDRIFVPAGDERQAFCYSRQYIIRSANPNAHDKYLSDHYVIKTMVKIAKDDD